MEASGSVRRLRLGYAFDLVAVHERDLEYEKNLVTEAASNRDELHFLLADFAGDLDLPIRVDIEAVEVKEGSIVVEVIIAIYKAAKALDLYGGAQEGLRKFIGDLQNVCRFFLDRLRPAPGRLRPRPILVETLPAVSLTLPPVSSRAQRWLLAYLILTNAALTAAVIFLAIRS